MRFPHIGSVSLGYLCMRGRVVERPSELACVLNKENADYTVGCKILERRDCSKCNALEFISSQDVNDISHFEKNNHLNCHLKEKFFIY